MDKANSKSSEFIQGFMPGLLLIKEVVLAHKSLLILSVVCLLLGTVLDVGLVLAIKQLLDGMQAHLSHIVEQSPAVISAMVMAIICLRELIAVVQNHRLSLLTYNIGASLKRQVVIAHRTISFTKLTQISKNQVLTLFRNVDDVVDFTRQGLIVTIREAMTLVGTIIAMLYLNFTLAMAFILITPLAYGVVKTMANKSKLSAESALIARNQLNQHVLHGHENWIAFHTSRLARDSYLSRLSVLLASYKSHGISLTMASVWLSMLTQFWIGLMLAAIIYLMLTGAMGATTGTMAAFLYAVARLRSPSQRIADLRSIYDQALTSANAINEFVQHQRTFKHYHQANPIAWQQIEFIDLKYAIKNKELYPNPINCKFKKGDHIMLVGASGVGKTTMLHMFALLIQPSSGVIRIDENPLNEDLQESWFESMVYVEQFSSLLSASMRDNLTTFSSATDEMCLQVLELAGLKNWLGQYSLDTKIGDGGVQLSGGERQRVILARIMLQCTGKSVVLLDEVFSALDTDGGYDLTKILLDYLKGSLVLSVSHRDNTLDLFNRILILDAGSGLKEMSHGTFKNKFVRKHSDESAAAMA